jgi:hypothetical protein
MTTRRRSDYALIRDTPVVNTDTGEECMLPSGAVVRQLRGEFSTRRQSSLAHYFVELKSKVDSLPEDVSRIFFEHLISDLATFGGIDVTLMHDLLKRIYGIESVAFHRLSEEEFQKYKTFAISKINSIGGYEC